MTVVDSSARASLPALPGSPALPALPAPPALPALPALGALALAAVIAAASACTPTAAQPADPPPMKVAAAEVLERDVTEWDEFTGRLEAVNTVELRPRVSGYVSRVAFTEGALVRAGAVLFEIDPRPFQADVDRLRAELVRAQAVAERASAEQQRAARLRAENAIATEEHDRRVAFAKEAAAQVAAVLAALGAEELNLEFTRVTAPISGRIGRAVVTEGNLVSSGPGDATLLTTIVSLDPIYAYFEADEQMFLKYANGARGGGGASAGLADLPVRMALASDPGFPREGRIHFLDNQVNPATGTIRVRALFRNPDHDLTPGLFVRVRLAGNGTHQGLLVQDRAIGTDLDKKFVLVVEPGGTVAYRAVTLGRLVDGLRLVRSGLTPGDVVVVSGLQRVRPGASVATEMIAMEEVAGGSTPPAVAAPRGEE